MKVTRLPFDPGPAVWNAILPEADTYPLLEGNRQADIVVIGAGFAGISAARQLIQQDPALKIAVLEARRVAEGPAGRNSGFMIDLPHNLGSKDYAGQDNQDRLQTAMNREAIAFAGGVIDDYGVSAEAFEISGKTNAAATEKGTVHNHDYAAHLERLNEPYQLLDAAQMRELSGTDYYQTGLYTPGTAMLQPALYMRGFAAGLARDGVSIFENSPVVDLVRENKGWKAITSNGHLSCGTVVLATNGHVESFGHFKKQLIHIYLYGAMTRALSDAEQKALGGRAKWGFTPADPMGTTVRKFAGTGGTRLIVRNSITWAPKRTVSENEHLKFSHIHDDSFVKRFPMLKHVDLEYRWGGLLCLSRNAVPAFGALEEGLFSACCQNGLGTAIGTLSGMAIADKILGQDTERLRFFQAQDQPISLPPAPFAALSANALFKWKQFRAGREL